MLPTPGGEKGAGGRGAEVYSELWFIVLMAVLGLILLAIFLSLILQRKIHKEPYIRERPPLEPVQKRMSPLSVYPPGESHMVCVRRRPRPRVPLGRLSWSGKVPAMGQPGTREVCLTGWEHQGRLTRE